MVMVMVMVGLIRGEFGEVEWRVMRPLLLMIYSSPTYNNNISLFTENMKIEKSSRYLLMSGQSLSDIFVLGSSVIILILYLY